jgi:uncharacterized protein (DUF1810 family)
VIYDLSRFLKAQANTFGNALSEINAGRKQTHWMWFIFPQVNGLGFSETSKFYAIQNLGEARAYLNHGILGERLIEITEALLKLEEKNPTEIFGSPDDMKLKSSMTLFVMASEHDKNAFHKVLEKFYQGELVERTLRILRNQ